MTCRAWQEVLQEVLLLRLLLVWHLAHLEAIREDLYESQQVSVALLDLNPRTVHFLVLVSWRWDLPSIKSVRLQRQFLTLSFFLPRCVKKIPSIVLQLIFLSFHKLQSRNELVFLDTY